MNDQGHAYLRALQSLHWRTDEVRALLNFEGVEALTELEEAISEVG